VLQPVNAATTIALAVAARNTELLNLAETANGSKERKGSNVGRTNAETRTVRALRVTLVKYYAVVDSYMRFNRA